MPRRKWALINVKRAIGVLNFTEVNTVCCGGKKKKKKMHAKKRRMENTP
jgi:hypothetical protein